MPHLLGSWLPYHQALAVAAAIIGIGVAMALFFLSQRGATQPDPAVSASEGVKLGTDNILPILAIGASAAALAGFVFILKASTPIWDDGALVLSNRLPITLASALKPYHEHLNLVPIAIWALLDWLFGSSTWTFLAVLLLTHFALATGTAALLVARLGNVAGFALVLPLALLGSAHYDILMPYQIVFTIPLLCGLIAVWLSIPRDRALRRRIGVAGALLIGILTSDVALFVILAMGIWFLLDGRWRQIGDLLPAMAVWFAWFVTIGRNGLNDGWHSATVGAIIPYTLTGIASGIGGLAGLSPTFGGLFLVAGLVVVVVRRWRPGPAYIAFAIALVAMFATGSLFRSYGSANQATANRYIYLVGYILVFAMATAAPKIAHPWRLVPVAIVASVLNLIAFAIALPGYP
jgi:hypothetical protein